MSLPLRVSTSIVAFLLPAMVLAAPSDVSGLRLAYEGSNVRVTWTPLKEDVKEYRIFYSHASILENGGLYDDFEVADGSANSLLLQQLPGMSDLYVSILAVNSAGEESPYFMEEAHLALGTSPEPRQISPDASSASSSAPNPTSSSAPSSPSPGLEQTSSTPLPASSAASSAAPATEQRMLKAEALSATGVVLTFALPVQMDQKQAVSAITIDTGSGKPLALRRFIIQDSTITVHTEPQVRGIAYRVQISAAITGVSDAKQVPLASDQSPMLFTGHTSGIEPAASVTEQPRTNISDLRLRAQASGDTYILTVTWQPATGDVVGYEFMQSMNGGQSYGDATNLGANTTSATVSNVPAGSFGVLIRTVYSDGSRAVGLAQVITLPGEGTALQGNVIQPIQESPSSPTLPSSGPEIWLGVMTLGSLLGTLLLRKRRTVA